MRHTKNNKTYIVTVNDMVVPNIRVAAEMVGITSKALYIRVFRQCGRDLIATINGHNINIQQFRGV